LKAPHLEGVGPLSIAKQGHFYAGGKYFETPAGRVFAGHAYVEYQIPTKQTQPYPIVMIEGASTSGAQFTGTPDGRDGWAQYFLAQGYAVYVVDQVGRGRSAYVEAVYGPKDFKPSALDHHFISSELTNSYQQAHLHTQWPGSLTPGDPVFDQWQSEMHPNIKDATLREKFNRDAGIALLDRIGPAIVMPHSQSGAYAWLMADARPDLVKALVMIEAGTALYREIELTGAPEWFGRGDLVKPYGLTRLPLSYSPPVKSADELSFVLLEKAEGPGLAPYWLQQEPARQLPNLKDIPVLLVQSEASFSAPTAHGISAFLKQAGLPNDLLCLEQAGIRGNAHFMMLEKNNLEIAAAIAGWLAEHIRPLETADIEKAAANRNMRA
jgi:pimeloyl-ACP methyl ester carboxylesterase